MLLVTLAGSDIIDRYMTFENLAEPIFGVDRVSICASNAFCSTQWYFDLIRLSVKRFILKYFLKFEDLTELYIPRCQSSTLRQVTGGKAK